MADNDGSDEDVVEMSAALKKRLKQVEERGYLLVTNNNKSWCIITCKTKSIYLSESLRYEKYIIIFLQGYVDCFQHPNSV